MRDAKSLFASRKAIRVGLFLAQRISPRSGHALARGIANLLAWLRPQMYWNIRANLRQILGPDTPVEVLHETARRTLIHAGCAYYDHFHAVGGAPEELAGILNVPELFWETLSRTQKEGRGLVLVTGHLSNFDLAALSLMVRGVRLQALSLREPTKGFQFLNQLRSAGGVEVTPITEAAIRQALRRLRQGGIVMTGVDYPTGPGHEPLNFFGRPALLPTGHVRLAMIAGALLLVVGVVYGEETGYALRVAPPLELIRTGNRGRDVRLNAERVLDILAGWIREHPEQWMMFLPVWPELLERR